MIVHMALPRSTQSGRESPWPLHCLSLARWWSVGAPAYALLVSDLLPCIRCVSMPRTAARTRPWLLPPPLPLPPAQVLELEKRQLLRTPAAEYDEREERRHRAAAKVQAHWRGLVARRRWCQSPERIKREQVRGWGHAPLGGSRGGRGGRGRGNVLVDMSPASPTQDQKLRGTAA